MRGFSAGKSDAGKRATTFRLIIKPQLFLYNVRWRF